MKFFKNENVPNLLGEIAREKIRNPLIRIMQICYGSAGMSVAEKDTIQTIVDLKRLRDGVEEEDNENDWWFGVWSLDFIRANLQTY